MNTPNKAKKDIFSTLLAIALLGSMILAIVAYYFGFNIQDESSKMLKDIFFIPLKKWIFPVIAISMFGVFFRSPQGGALKFIILFVDIILLYLLSTFIANSYAFFTFPLLPFADVIAPLIGDAQDTIFKATTQKGVPTVIWFIILGLLASFVCRYILHKLFFRLAKIICGILVKIFSCNLLDSISFIHSLKNDHQKASDNGGEINHSLALINFTENFIFRVLMVILLLAPLAVFGSFLSMLHEHGFVFFIHLGKFIASYAAILLSYQFLVLPLVRKIFCFGLNSETYGSFFKKSLPVIVTAGTTASSIATLSTNIKAAQSLKVDKDMKNKGHNRALMPIGATFNMDGTSISLVIYFLLAANLAGMDVNFWWVALTAVTLSIGTAAVPSASLVMLTSMYSAFSMPAVLTGKLLSIIIAVDPIHDRIRTVVNTWGDLNMVYIVQSKRGIISIFGKIFKKKSN